MSSTDGEQGVKLKDFINMWQADGTKLVEQERRNLNGHIWILFAVYYPESTYEYGRHGAMLMKVDAKTDIILLHDCKNLSGEVNKNYRQGIDEWFNKHATGAYYYGTNGTNARTSTANITWTDDTTANSTGGWTVV